MRFSLCLPLNLPAEIQKKFNSSNPLKYFKPLSTPKKRLVKDYDALPEDIVRALKIKYPTGYEEHLISYVDAKGKKVSALPFEADDAHYLVRMTIVEAKRLIKEDEDFDDEGILKEGFAGAGDGPDVAEDEDAVTDEDHDEFNDDGGEDDHIIVTRRRDDDDEAADMADDY